MSPLFYSRVSLWLLTVFAYWSLGVEVRPSAFVSPPTSKHMASAQTSEASIKWIGDWEKKALFLNEFEGIHKVTRVQSTYTIEGVDFS